MPPVEKRWDKWVDTLADRLRALEFTITNLSNNPLFITGFMQASQIVLRAHQEEKLNALRNAVTNMARPLFADDNLLLMFMSWIDIFTPWHIRVLNFVHSPGEPNENWLDVPIGWRAKSAFPQGEVDMDLIKQILVKISKSKYNKNRLNVIHCGRRITV